MFNFEKIIETSMTGMKNKNLGRKDNGKPEILEMGKVRKA